MKDEAKLLYTSLLSSGELKQVVKGMRGSWEEDEKRFRTYHRQNLEFINDFEITDVEDADF